MTKLFIAIFIGVATIVGQNTPIHNPKLVGPLDLTGVTGTVTFPGTVNMSSSVAARNLPVPVVCSGDCGVLINAAIAALPVSGGQIDIANSGTISTTIPIASVNYLRLHCLGTKGSVTLTDGIVANPAEPMIKISGTSSEIVIDGCRFQGNNLTGASGNGHAISVMGTSATLSNNPIRVTVRDSSFWYFSGNGKDSTGASIGATGVYAAQGHVLRSETNDYVSNQYGMYLDGGYKVSVLGGDFNGNIHNGIFVRVYPSTVTENIYIGDEALFNSNGSGGATDGGIYATNFYNTTITGNRFKLNNPSDLITGPDASKTLNFQNNHVYRTSGTSPSVSIHSATSGVNACANSFFFDNLALNAVGIQLVASASGNINKSALLCSNNFFTAQQAGVAIDKAIWVGANNKGASLVNNSVGDDGTGGGESVNYAWYIDGTDTTLIGNSCVSGTSRTITNCAFLNSTANRTIELNTTCTGTVSTCINDTGTNTSSIRGGNMGVGTSSGALDRLSVVGAANTGVTLYNGTSQRAGFRWNTGAGGYFYLLDNSNVQNVSILGNGDSYIKGGKTAIIPPVSCSGQATGTIYNNAGAAGFCP